MQIGWQEIVQTVIGGALLYLVVEGIKLLIRRRKSKRTRIEERIAKLTAEIKQYENWQENKVGFLMDQVSNLTYTVFVIALMSFVMSFVIGMERLARSFLGPSPNSLIPVASQFFVFVMALWIVGSCVLSIVASGIFFRIAQLRRADEQKKRLEKEIDKLIASL
jgi:uncharacterized integral membrane protein